MRRGTPLPVMYDLEFGVYVRGAGKEDASAQIQVRTLTVCAQLLLTSAQEGNHA